MKKIAIVYHSGFGHTKFIAEKIKDGISKSSVNLYNVSDFIADENKLSQLANVDMIIFGAPTYMGSVSAEFKKFMDLTSKVWYSQGWKDKFAAGFTASGGLNGDKANTMNTLVTFACQHSMVWVSQGVFSDGKLNNIGSWTGYYARAENAAPEVSFDESALNTAKAFGARVDNFINK